MRERRSVRSLAFFGEVVGWSLVKVEVVVRSRQDTPWWKNTFYPCLCFAREDIGIGVGLGDARGTETQNEPPQAKSKDDP